MSVGIRFRNASSIVTIDDTMPNYGLYSKGQLVAGPAANNSPYSTVSVEIPINGIIAFQCNGTAGYFYTTMGSSTKTVFFQVKGAGVVLNYWVFNDTGYAVDTSVSYGMRVRRRTDGALVFDSRAKYMRVIDFQQGQIQTSQGPPAGAPANVNLNYSIQPAVVVITKVADSQLTGVPGTGSDPVGQYLYQSQVFIWGGAATLTTGLDMVYGYTYDRLSQAGSDPNQFRWSIWNYAFMCLDVTGL